MEHLLEKAEIMEKIKKAPELLLMLDFDGTLAPIVERPKDAAMPEDVRRLLEGLKEKGARLVVISGRTLDDIKARVGIPGIIYVGNHGMEVEGVPQMEWDPAKARRVMDRLSREELEDISHLQGVTVEDKDLTLSIHYRLAGTKIIERLMKLFADLISPLGESLRVTRGKKVLEVRPAGVPDKGDIALYLAGLFPSSLPIYIGDDTTDEDAFRALRERGAVTVLVSPEPGRTLADFYLRDPRDVERFLAIVGG
ncbi:MAG: trehalose-phosphatase [Euryarchaeota archaeon]|nr:trehalose-phosphatase [Euryarchaeota archaeon]